MNSIKISSLLLAMSSILIFSGCSVTKNVNKSQTSTESASKVDSSAVENKDIEKVSKVKTVITELSDTAVVEPGFTAVVKKDTVLQDGTRVEFKGTAVKITKPTRQIPVKINKTTTVTADIKETDKSKTRVEVKKKEKKEETKKEVVKDIKKTGVQWYWWILIVLAVVAGLAWKFRKHIF